MVNSLAEKQPPFSQAERLHVRPFTLAATSGNRQLPPLPVGLWLQSTIVNGYPDWCVVVPVHCHPPRIPRTKRSEEHTSELQSQSNLVCRLLLEKKKKKEKQKKKTNKRIKNYDNHT